MIALMLGTVMAFVGVPQNVEAMTVRPMSEAEAVSEFENACVLGLRDPGLVSASATRSTRRYVEGQGSNDAGGTVRNWSSPFGSVQYVDRAPGHDGRGFRECSFTAFTSDRVNRRALTDQLDALASRRAVSRLVSVEDGKAMGWIWRDGQGRRVALYSVANNRTPQQITLSIKSEDISE